MLDPAYWKIQPYKVAPGIIDFKAKREALPLNVIVLFEKKNQIYEFKKLLTINYNVSQLRNICRYYKQKVSGNKNQLITLLYNYLFKVYIIILRKDIHPTLYLLIYP